MGCTLCKSNNMERIVEDNNEHEVKKEYSWDKRNRENLSQYLVENKNGQTICKPNDSINGEQFIVQNCEGCNIYLLDHMNMVTVDDCTNCNMIFGPVKGSIFIRNCKDCRVVAACQQFRTRDCQGIDAYLCCTTHPIIEASSNMKFGCHQMSYSCLEDHIHKANLSIFNNSWYDIRDFTPVADESNWSLLPADLNIEEVVKLPGCRPLELENTTISGDALVPLTLGISRRHAQKSCLVVIFNDGHSQKRALSFINGIKCNYPQVGLLRTKEIKMDGGDAKRVLRTDSYNSVIDRGPVIGLEYNGTESIEACQKTAMAISTDTGSTGLVYVSGSVEGSSVQIQEFFDLADMQIKI